MAQGTVHRAPSSLQLSTYCCNILVDRTALRKQIPISMNYFKIGIFHVFLKKINIVLTFGETCSLVFSLWTSSWTDSQQQGEFWEPCDWTYLRFLGSSYGYAVNIKSGPQYKLKWIRDCARNPAPQIACSSNAINSSVASPSDRLLLQIGHSGLSLLILLSVAVHYCLSMVEGLPFLCFGT